MWYGILILGFFTHKCGEKQQQTSSAMAEDISLMREETGEWPAWQDDYGHVIT